MVVQHNLTAMNANRYFGINNSKLSKSLEKLSSGYAINRAGDNAAGLAVSEKMRSQIGGLTQAVKNAQDGISMVQTYEGALTETDSILQRMKVLATQSANGSYDDPIDRNAIEQEFLQLNDELDQIADTDFNGVVVLNGGTMADGVKADANGLIDYAAAAKVAAAEAAKKPIDIGGSEFMNTVDDLKYNKTAADTLWAALNLSGNTKTVDVTFTRDATGAWTATSASKMGENGDLTKVTAVKADVTNASGFGGFRVAVKGNGSDIKEANGGTTTAPTGDITATGIAGGIANVIFDEKSAKAGDTVTITFSRTSTSNYAPDNIGFVNGTGNKSDTFTGNYTVSEDAATITTSLTDDAMNATVAEGLEKLNGMELVVGYGNAAKAADAAATTYALQNQTELEDAGFTVTQDTANKNKFTISYKGTDLAVFTAAAGTNGSGAEIAAANDATTSSSTISYKIALDAFKFEENATEPYSATVKVPESEEEYKVSQSNAFNKSEAKMTYKDSITLQVGARTKDAVNFTFQYQSTAMGDLEADLNCTAAGLGTDKLSLGTQESANIAIDKIDQAINKVSMVRGTFGAIQNRLEHKIDNLNVTTENLTSAESRIRDTDMASEMMNFTKQQILSQASQSMLAQANQLPQGVLSLLQ